MASGEYERFWPMARTCRGLLQMHKENQGSNQLTCIHLENVNNAACVNTQRALTWCIYPRGKYSKSPGSSTASKTGGDGKSASEKFTADIKMTLLVITSTITQTTSLYSNDTHAIFGIVSDISVETLHFNQ